MQKNILVLSKNLNKYKYFIHLQNYFSVELFFNRCCGAVNWVL